LGNLTTVRRDERFVLLMFGDVGERGTNRGQCGLRAMWLKWWRVNREFGLVEASGVACVLRAAQHGATSYQ
jgi:hypothetical protein